jgi:ABC-2 type transport system permease protein
VKQANKMGMLKVLLQKEFRQIFRNKTILIISFIAPVMQFLILPLAANFEIKNINLAIVDHDRSSTSQKLTSQITGSGFFKLVDYSSSFKQAYHLIETDKADLILEVPVDFEQNLMRENSGKIFIAVNAINGTKAVVGGNYLDGIIAETNKNILVELIPNVNLKQGVDLATTYWFNPKLNYKIALIPGILAILVTMIGGFLSALNIVKEKESGTIEQINVTPIRKIDFILGKLIPFWILAMIVFTIGLTLAYLIYDIVPQGNLLVLYCFISVYLLAVLGFGLLISTFCNTQQEAMFLAFFFVMIFILLGGLFTSIDSMPEWAKMITKINPVNYMINVMRLVLLKGSGFRDILSDFIVVLVMALLLNGWAVLNYRKTT